MDDDGRATPNGPITANNTMVETVELMLAELGPLDPTRTVLAATARRLAATLDAMDGETANRMIGQTAGALTKVVEKLGLPQQAAATTAPLPQDAPASGEVWYEGFEEDQYREELLWRISQHARRHGLPIPGSPQYSANPWADDVLDRDPRGRRMRIRGARAWYVSEDAGDRRQALRLAASPDNGHQ